MEERVPENWRTSRWATDTEWKVPVLVWKQSCGPEGAWMRMSEGAGVPWPPEPSPTHQGFLLGDSLTLGKLLGMEPIPSRSEQRK